MKILIMAMAVALSGATRGQDTNTANARMEQVRSNIVHLQTLLKEAATNRPPRASLTNQMVIVSNQNSFIMAPVAVPRPWVNTNFFSAHPEEIEGAKKKLLLMYRNEEHVPQGASNVLRAMDDMAAGLTNNATNR